jgi:rifampicin phosphotransferase
MSSPEASPFLLRLDSPLATLELVGGKGASLARMSVAGLPVPPGFHITTHAYRRFVDENHLGDRILSAAARAQANDPATLDWASAQIQSLITNSAIPGDIAEMIQQWYGELDADAAVAVRSSATAEDLPGMSFAGQLETYLNICGGHEVIDAVKRCWASLWTGRAIAYRERYGIRTEDVSMAVVVQKLVPAEVAGVLFTANPVTGARNELVINAAWGLGEAIVSGRVTPDTIIVNKQTGAIASQEIASKEIMTVRSKEGMHEEPVPVDKRKRAALARTQAAELARLGVKIEQLYGQAMDIEWAMCAGQIFIVQARPVTALPESRATPDWKVPSEGRQYWRTSVAELLPDPLSPMFATLALPLWNQALEQMAQSRRIQILTGEVGLVTIHEYVYYDFGLNAWQTARLLAALPVLIPRLIRIQRSARARWMDETRPHYANVTATWAGRDLSAVPGVELLAGAHEIVEAAANYYVSIQNILGGVNASEAIFTNLYNRLIKRKNDPPALTFLLGFDSTPIRAEKSLYDLAMWARVHGDLAEFLTRTSSQDIAVAYESECPPTVNRETWHEFTGRLAEHLKRFGHVVYDLDFAKSLPAEDPAALIETLKYFTAGQGRDPYERQATSGVAREQATESLLARLSGLRRRLFTSVLRWAQRWAPLREEALADVGLGWPVLRRIFREVGRRMAAAGALTEADEVFWLKWEEAEAAARALDGGQPAENYCRAIAERGETWKQAHAVAPPAVLPIKGGGRLFGFNVTRWMPARAGQTASNIIKGIGASPGRVAGEACVIHGPEEFNQMKPGDILVAKITTPAWTPLFALASGIVTDVGGPLSHSSIVAREYGVPAVLGTGVATHRIRSGQRITVDGNGGVVTMGG